MDLRRLRAVKLDAAIRQQRQRAGLTQRELAERASVSLATLRDLEQGRVRAPRAATVRAIAAALGMPAGEADELVAASAQIASTRPGLCIEILGPLAVSYNGTPIDLGSGRRRALLGVLCLSANEPVSHDALIDAVWGRRRQSGDAELLQTQLSRLRRRLCVGRPSNLLPAVAQSGGYQLNVDADQLDLLAFRGIVAGAQKLHNERDLSGARRRYEDALTLWRGEPLADLAELRANPAVVAVTRELWAAVLEYARISATTGRFDAAIPYLQRVIDADPLNEKAQAEFILALAGSGRQAAALAAFDVVRQRLREEVGTQPGDELNEALRRVLRQEISRPDMAPVGGHRQLPPDIADFTGREAEMLELHEGILASRQHSAAPSIAIIEGMAGIGKTKLAVHLAHRLISAGQYRDVQLYVDLRGYSEQSPADATTVLGAFLELLGMDRAEIPPDVETRAGLYRDLLRNKHALVVLDNAENQEQVLPLLPGASNNLALITSRRRLSIEGASTLHLPVFTDREARELLALVAGSDRVNADPVSSHVVVDLCGRLPIAVSLAARRLQARPGWSVADLAARLTETTDRLRELSAGSRRTQAVFDLSYQALTSAGRRVFRLLGIHPGDEFDSAAVAALLDVDEPSPLQELADEHLIEQIDDDRYRLHDLLRVYATARCDAEESAADLAAARRRLLAWYLYSAVSARAALSPVTTPLDLEAIDPPRQQVVLSSRAEALSWYKIERPNLVTCVMVAIEAGALDIAWRLAAALRTYFYLSKHWDDWIATHSAVLNAFEPSHDARGKASVLNGLGVAYSDTGRIDAAIDCHRRASEIYRGIDDPAAAAWNLNNLGVALGDNGVFVEAIDCHHEAVELFRRAGDLHGTGIALSNLGAACGGLGRYSEAQDHLRAALAIQDSIADREMQRFTYCALGDLFRDISQYESAADEYDRALQLNREYHDQWGSARLLIRIADVLGEMGHTERARKCLSDAMTISVGLGDPRAEEIRHRLSQVVSGTPNAHSV